MSDARHTPPGDDSFRSSLLRNSAGAVGLVVLVAVIFWAIGTLGGDRSLQAGADDGASDDAAAPADPEADAPEAPAPDEASDDASDAATDDGADEPDAPDEGADEPDEPDQPDAPEEGDDDPAAPSVPPAEVTIQVLDGYKEDGGTAADAVAELLGDAGYDIVARNDALSYDTTTVLYNPGNEEAAQQVAAELGGAEVREQPGNLSSAVALHVVVGSDRA